LHIERASVGNSPPKVARAALLPDGDGFQRQVKHNVFSRKAGKRSGSNKDLARKPSVK
jgi:hypothetical protein